jgi:hypothetical protein
MFFRQQSLVLATLALLALLAHQEPIVSAQDNSTSIDDIDCTCDDSIISCTEPSDEEDCVCDDGDVVCSDGTYDSGGFEAPVAAPSAVATEEPPAPETDSSSLESGAFSSGPMVSMAISVVGVAAVALN